MEADRPSRNSPDPTCPIRVWPGVLIVALQWFSRFIVPKLFPEAMPFGVIAGLVGAMAIILWWLFFSRARWVDRLSALAIMVLAFAGTSRLIHPSIRTGMMGLMFPVYVLPTLSLALVVSVALTRTRSETLRRGIISTSLLLACGIWTLVRTGGFTSDLKHDWAWRWSQTQENRLVATKTDSVVPLRQQQPTNSNGVAVWSGFRGPNRDGVVRGTRIATNWTARPPMELWRRPVGPGWSSFAVDGDLIYTQEQRGENEIVSCYTRTRGEPVWHHSDTNRFWESNSGPGPRGTPTLYRGRIYSFGPTGILNALDAQTGAVIWSRNAASDAQQKTPEWAFSSSPWVTENRVIVAIGGTLCAYERTTGEPRWTGPSDHGSYSSPHAVEIDGIQQILFMNGTGALSVTPDTGKMLWRHAWKGFAIVQPASIQPGDFLISTGDRLGARRIQVRHKNDEWTVTEGWTTTRLKAYFNDYVVHGTHAYGFDSGMLTCIDLEKGERLWKGGRYGSGQLILLSDQRLLLVLSEQGEVALVHAMPEEFVELGRIRALEGKTWNHPVLAGDTLLVRNAGEMVGYRLPLESN